MRREEEALRSFSTGIYFTVQWSSLDEGWGMVCIANIFFEAGVCTEDNSGTHCHWYRLYLDG